MALLSEKTISTCLLGRLRMLEDVHEFYAQWMGDLSTHKDCSGEGDCREAANEHLKGFCIATLTDISKLMFPLGEFETDYLSKYG